MEWVVVSWTLGSVEWVEVVNSKLSLLPRLSVKHNTNTVQYNAALFPPYEEIPSVAANTAKHKTSHIFSLL